MIKALDITKSFGDIPVLRGLNLDIKRGGIYGLAGRSGVGKSTFLRCINGLEEYDGGSITVDGTVIKNLSEKDMRSFRKNIGMIFQQFSLLERLTVYDNIALPLRCWKYKQRHIDKKVRDLLDIVGISEKINQKPRELSGGQKQRVAIARALAMEPHILLCDEATSALDPKTTKSIVALLKEINKEMGITIVFVSHQMSVIRDLCRDMAIIEHGRVAVSGSVNEIFSLQHSALKNLLGEDTSSSADMKSLMLFFSKNNGDFIMLRMASDLGIDLIIRGEAASWSKMADGYIISFHENNSSDVMNYLLANGVSWKMLNNGVAMKVRDEKQRGIYRPDMSVMHPGLV